MSVPKYGRVTPLQMDMLGLGGEICLWYQQRPPTDDERTKEMRSSREVLQRLTGLDFGYDLEAWHERLLSDQQYSEQYTHPYAWEAVKPKILELIKDPNRLRLVQIIEQADQA
ncbi:MAG TPA: hypothetical protein VG269_29440 [Tepidisphaeraceae bacterium]|nr:hypothetical protein [Tepidisphaeraceae bacterium]